MVRITDGLSQQFCAAGGWLRAPDAKLPALESAQGLLTYADLELRVASQRMAIGADRWRGKVVAVEKPRSADYVVTLLALFAAGAIIMPVDPDLPVARRDLMRRIAVPLANIDAMGVTCELSGENALCRDEEAAYVFFTSGTTGRPKAILGARGALRGFIDWQGQEFDIRPGDRIPFLTSIGFDVSLRDVLLPLRNGATLVIPEPETIASPERLVRWMGSQEITRLHIVPSVARMWAGCDAPPFERMRTMFSAGEKLTPATLSALMALAPGAEIVNLYGPTETTLAKFCFRLPRGFRIKGDAAPVGRPIPNTRFTLARDGEIVIHTADASLGYIGASEEENARFDRRDGIVTYRTGDLGAITEEGYLAVTGRVDDQVKINGIRVHLQEVERAVLAARNVSDAKVVAIAAGEHGDCRLAAVWTGNGMEDAAPRAEVACCLPQGVVPTLWRRVEKLPLNANGKVDAVTIAAMFDARGNRAGRLPGTALEQWICNAAAALLGIAEPGPDDDFFALGGTSLQVAVLVGRIESELSRRVSLASIFQHSRLADIAATIALAPPARADAIARAARRQRYCLSPAQRRWWNIYMPYGNRSWATMVRLFAFDRVFSGPQVRAALHALIREQDSLRIVIDDSGSEPMLARWPVPDLESVPVEELDLSRQAPETAAAALDRLRLDIANAEIPTATWPLFRCHVIAMPQGRSTFLFAMHHMVCDGFSMGLIETTMRRLLACGDKPEPRRLPYNFLDFAVWSRAQESAEFGPGSEAENYWARVFEGPYRKHVFPDLWTGRDHDRGQAYCCEVPEELRRKARLFAQRHRLTSFSVYFAAKFLAWHHLLERDDLVIGTPASGREVPGSENVVGNFISLCCVRSTRPRPGDSLVEYARRIMVAVASAMSFQGYQYDVLVRRLGMEFEQDRFPLTTIFISYMDFESVRRAPLDRAELGFSDLGYAVKFDVMSYVREHSDCATLQIQYRNNLFERRSITAFAERWLTELHRLADDPSG